MPDESLDGEEKEYTIDEMADYLAREVSSGEELLSVLAEHGFELKSSESPMEDMMDDPMEAVEEVVEEVSPEGGEEMEMGEEMGEMMPMPPVSGEKPQLNIVAARFRAADNALKKGKKSNERR